MDPKSVQELTETPDGLLRDFEGREFAPVRLQQRLHQGTDFRGQPFGIGLKTLDGQKAQIPRELRPSHRALDL